MTISLPTYEEVLTKAIVLLAVDSGEVSNPAAAGSNSLIDSSKAWAANMHINRIVKIVSGAGKGQQAFILGNTQNALIIGGTWFLGVEAGSRYVVINADYAQILRDVFGGGINISAANPLPVDISPGLKAATQIISLATLAAGATSVLANCVALDLRLGPPGLAITVAATYNAAATAGLRVHIRTSYDNINWDTEDWDTWLAGFTAGATIRQTEHYDADPMYLRVLIENLDAVQAITNILVFASVGA